ncbi:hypothetical protein [Streptomyces bacillaris]|uniref:hypothetical protein n=1 Tax=Streptomyces bacillaris TaxID=68179 RepID=UPI0034600328
MTTPTGHFEAATRAVTASGDAYTSRRARAAALAVGRLGATGAAAALGLHKSVLSRLAARGRGQGQDQSAPGAVCLGFVDPDSAEGHDARRESVHTGQIPAILGLGPNTREGVRAEALGAPFRRLPAQDPEAAAMGTRHLPALAALFAERHPEYAVLETGTWQATGERGWMRSSPNRLLTTPGDRDQRAVSVLTVTTFPRPYDEEWGPDGSDRVPPWLRARSLWEMDVLGVRDVHVLACAQGAYCREYRLTWDENRAADIRQKAEAFLAETRTILAADGSEI